MAVTFFATNPNVSRGIASYNQGLTQESLGRMQEAAAITEAQLKAQVQRDALRSQAQQNSFLNAMEQQRLNQQGEYQKGMLGNQRAQMESESALQQALAQSNASEAEKERQTKLRVAEMTTGARNAVDPTVIQDANNQAQALAGRMNFMLEGLRKSQADEESRIKGNEQGWLTRDATFKKTQDNALGEIALRYRAQMQKLMQDLPMDAPIDFDQARGQFVAKTIVPQGTSAPPPAEGPRFFAPPAQAIPAAPVNVPAIAPVAPPATNAPPSAFFGGQPAGVVPAQPYMVRVQASDGSVWTVPSNQLSTVRQRDPNARVIDAPQPATTGTMNDFRSALQSIGQQFLQ